MASNSDDVKWNSQQKEAIERIRNWSNKTTPEMQISLSGAAGTGKSTLLSAVKPFLDSQSVAWSAMTGKAALRMKEAAGVEAKTLHSVLYGRPNKGRNNKLYFNKLKQPDCKFLVIDECFEYKQRILTEHGWQQIGLIVKKKLKTRVWSRNPITGMLELKPVIGWLEKPAPLIICHINATHTKDGIATVRHIKCTFDHKILTPNGYIKAIDLMAGDEVIGCDYVNYRSKETNPAKVKWNRRVKPSSEFVYDIEVEDNHNYVAGNVIVSNCSMIGPKMYQDLQAWAAQGVRILYVGDGYQLPPVLDYKEVKEYGNEFSVFSNVDGPRLTQVMRSGDDIIKVATQLREENQLPKYNIGSSYRIKRSATPGMNAIDEWMADNDNHMMITWRNKMRMAANRLVRKRLGFSGVIPNKTEPIMLCKNGETDSGAVLNGEIYFAEDFREAAHFGDEVKCVNFYTDSGLNIFANIQGKDEPMDGQFPNVTDWPMYMSHFKISRLPEPITLTYGYVGTAHKCQGSEYRRVTIFLSAEDLVNPHFRKDTTLPDGSKMSFASRWAYTSLTRARQQVSIILGS